MEEQYFLDYPLGEVFIRLYEKDGTFYNHNTQDLLIATFYDEDKAKMVLNLLNKNAEEQS